MKKSSYGLLLNVVTSLGTLTKVRDMSLFNSTRRPFLCRRIRQFTTHTEERRHMTADVYIGSPQ